MHYYSASHESQQFYFNAPSTTQGHLETIKQHGGKSARILKLFWYVKLYRSQAYKFNPNTNVTREISQQARKVTIPNQSQIQYAQSPSRQPIH